MNSPPPARSAYTLETLMSRWVTLGLNFAFCVCACVGLACSSDAGKPSDPSATLPVDAAATPQDAGEAGAKKALAADCTDNAECESGICYKGARAGWCSLACTQANAAQVCTGIFGGSCNQLGFCRRPN